MMILQYFFYPVQQTTDKKIVSFKRLHNSQGQSQTPTFKKLSPKKL